MSNSDYDETKTPEQWVQIAIGNLEAVCLMELAFGISRQSDAGNSICYMSQLVAEKMMKALCTAMGGKVRMDHNLRDLEWMIRGKYALGKSTRDAIQNLNRYGVAARYSAELNSSRAEALGAIDDMRVVCNSMNSKLKFEKKPDLEEIWKRTRPEEPERMISLMLSRNLSYGKHEEDRIALKRWLMGLKENPEKKLKVIPKVKDTSLTR